RSPRMNEKDIFPDQGNRKPRKPLAKISGLIPQSQLQAGREGIPTFFQIPVHHMGKLVISHQKEGFPLLHHMTDTSEKMNGIFRLSLIGMDQIPQKQKQKIRVFLLQHVMKLTDFLK